MKQVLTLLLTVLVIASCQKAEVAMQDAMMAKGIKATENNQTSTNTQTSSFESFIITDPCGDPVVVDLLAGQFTLVGNVTVLNDEDEISVTYNITTVGWEFEQTHLYVGDCNQIPVNNAGNPKIGQFPYQTDPHLAGTTTFTYTIPLDSLNTQDSCFCIAAHASVLLLDTNGNVIQQETAWADGDRFNQQGPWSTFFQHCLEPCDGGQGPGGQDTCDFRTQTMGGWGAPPHGNNPGTYVHANFASAFPGGLSVGCDLTLDITSAQAVTDFLPSGGKPRALDQNYTDPTNNLKNVLAGQTVALKLTVLFDRYDPSFSGSTTDLGDLTVVSGTFGGFTVDQVLAEAELILGGCASNFSASEVNDALSSINENFVEGIDGGFLNCP